MDVFLKIHTGCPKKMSVYKKVIQLINGYFLGDTSKIQKGIKLTLLLYSCIAMTNPSIPFWGLKIAKKGVSIAFLLSAVPISGS